MRIQDLVYDIIVEDIKNKKIFDFLLNKWYGESPSNEQKSEGEKLYINFTKIQNRLSPNLPEVITFLSRFNGERGLEKFEPSNLRDVSKYTYEQIKFLIGEYFEMEEINPEDNPIFRGRDLPPTDERNEASKNLWYSKGGNLIVDEEGFRVYYIPDQKTSINFGYYEGQVTNKPPYSEQYKSHMQWCTTRHIVNNNLWGSYRNRRTFYFVIDESKNPEVEPSIDINQYYLSALQYATDSGNAKYRVTSILNDGSDPIFDEQKLLSIYPKLRDHLDKIRPVDYDPIKEAGENTDIVNMMNELEGNRYEFAVMEKRHKKSYIDRGKPLTRGRSWESMDDALRKTYIDVTERHNVNERFSTKNLMDAIKQKPANVASLNRRLEILNLGGIGYINELLMKDYQTYRMSLDNPNVTIYRSISNKKYGIYNNLKIDWLYHNGISYEPEYVLNDDLDLYFDDEGNSYVVEKYDLNGMGSDKSFYCIFPNKESNTKNGGHFLSHNSFIALQEKLHPDNNVGTRMKDFKSDSDVDIKEIEKGV